MSMQSPAHSSPPPPKKLKGVRGKAKVSAAGSSDKKKWTSEETNLMAEYVVKCNGKIVVSTFPCNIFLNYQLLHCYHIL